MMIQGYEDAQAALMQTWLRQCQENHWPVETTFAEDVTTFVIDVMACFIVNKYAAENHDSLELAVQDAFQSREERRGERSFFSDIVDAAFSDYSLDPKNDRKEDE